MDSPHPEPARQDRRTRGRVIAGFTLALAISFGAFVLISAFSSAGVVFGSVWFLAFLPAYLCALICYVGDPDGTKPARFYGSVPLIFGAIVIVGSIAILREGVICLIMLAPLWLLFGWLGAIVMRRMRNQPVDPNTFRSTLIFLPLFSAGLESQLPVTHDQVTLTREVVIRARPDEIWPYAVSIPHIAASEGRWTFTQNVLGLPRPRATTITERRKGGVRTAWWGDRINFEERITHWEPGRRLGWAFAFRNTTLQDYTDKHISPDGEFLKIDTGDYVLTPLADGTTRLTLRTNYIAKTHVNPYAAFWGEILLGDIQNNVLAIIRQRAEARHLDANVR
ncbi:SRPBCC family protein [Novosphingobium sp.]|uniref:SRPBCC family protein n=1 Tax=Novosphingobium sp. TaxID=1874826 RepID=UPI0026283795|nr:SRPBCC family protein [Novosphingobium sp.]